MAKWTPPWANGSDMAFVPVGLANQGVTFAQYEQMTLPTGERDLTDDEVNQVLSGDFNPLGLTADADADEAVDAKEQTGAMIALLPDEATMERLAVPGGEEDEELHTTLCYLGDAAKIPPQRRDYIIDMVRQAVKNIPVVDGDGFGVAMLNQEDDMHEPCVVLLVSGAELEPVQRLINGIAQDALPEAYPEQYTPWLPHITLQYSSDTSLVATLSDREGPVRYDHIRVAFGGEVTDFPLYDGTAQSDPVGGDLVEQPMEQYEDGVTAADISPAVREKAAKKHHAMPDGSYPIRNVSDLHNAIQAIGRAKNPDAVKAFIRKRARELHATDALPAGWAIDTTLAGKKESNVRQVGGNHNLKDYWTHGPGAAKIGWGTDGSFARCVAQLGKYVSRPQGLCAEYHKAATGEWPTQGGKHGIPSEVDIEAFAENMEVVVADGEVDLAAELGDYDGGWIGPLAVEDVDTGDQRMFSGGSLTWEDPEAIIHPFQWAQSNLGEHKGSVTAGRIDRIWRDPQNPRTIMGKGRFNLGDPDGLRAFRQVRDGFAGGVSIDPDQVTDADVELEFAIGEDPSNPFAKPTKTIFHKGRLRGATLVAFPALIEAAIRLTKKGETSAVVASVTDEPWKSLENELRLGEGDLDGLVAAGAFAYVRDIDDLVPRHNCRFLHHEIDEDGQPGRASLVACGKHIAAINTGRTFGLNPTELRAAYSHMAQHFTDAGMIAPSFTLNVEAIVAAAPKAAPLEWFGDPNLSAPTPITVTEDGRVFGHAAVWGTCHTGFADTCVTPPHESDYAYFTTGEVLTAEGHRVAVGQITLGTSHAATRGLSVAKAVDHYGDTGTAVADVTAGTDAHGIWVSGAVRPGITDEHVHALRASALSGDWRRIGGSLRMVALLAVNVPGFPIPRTGTALAAGKQVSLVAAGVIDRATFTFDDEIAQLAGQCGIPVPAMGKTKKKLKYDTLAEELVALAAEIKE